MQRMSMDSAVSLIENLKLLEQLKFINEHKEDLKNLALTFDLILRMANAKIDQTVIEALINVSQFNTTSTNKVIIDCLVATNQSDVLDDLLERHKKLTKLIKLDQATIYSKAYGLKPRGFGLLFAYFSVDTENVYKDEFTFNDTFVTIINNIAPYCVGKGDQKSQELGLKIFKIMDANIDFLNKYVINFNLLHQVLSEIRDTAWEAKLYIVRKSFHLISNYDQLSKVTKLLDSEVRDSVLHECENHWNLHDAVLEPPKNEVIDAPALNAAYAAPPLVSQNNMFANNAASAPPMVQEEVRRERRCLIL